MLTLFRATVGMHGSSDALLYFDGTLTFDELDARSDAFAESLLATGFSARDRVALYLQNDPSFVIALLGIWKAGGAAVVMNPMYRQREVNYLLSDSGATVLVCLDERYKDVITDVIAGGDSYLQHVFISSPRDDQTRD
ncbi:AMP-binding protein, partial [Rhodococcus qingshengii]|uniref:AMP-binding protein n=1 Tax=Rhodococcus qingshengii TaxID=334542 RepID=UPI001BE75E8D